MMALDVVFGIWALVLIAIGSISAVLGTRYFKKGKEYHDMQKQLLIEAETRVKRQYNKIAMLSVKDLNTYLAGIFARYMELNGELRPALKKAGFVTRDPREKERRKYGLKKARKASQFSKR